MSRQYRWTASRGPNRCGWWTRVAFVGLVDDTVVEVVGGVAPLVIEVEVEEVAHPSSAHRSTTTTSPKTASRFDDSIEQIAPS
jgi:hypothetical protein